MTIYGQSFADLYDQKWSFFSDRMWPFASQHVRRLQPEAKTWLDLCCGTGALLRLAIQDGFVATGLDASFHQLRIAHRNAPAACLIRADVRKFSLKQQFDVVSCFFDSVNYLLTVHDLTQALRCARHHLNDGGILIFDLLAPAAFMNTRTYVAHDPEWTALMESVVSVRKSLRTTTITGFVRERDGLYRRFVEEHVQRAYTAKQVEKVLTSLKLNFLKYDGERFAKPHGGLKRMLYFCRCRA